MGLKNEVNIQILNAYILDAVDWMFFPMAHTSEQRLWFREFSIFSYYYSFSVLYFF
jgi:hypothetical protein